MISGELWKQEFGEETDKNTAMSADAKQTPSKW